MPGTRRRSVAVLLALVAGIVPTFCFRRDPISGLAWGAFAPLCWFALAARWPLRRRCWAGWLAGTVFWLVNVSWIAHTIGVHGGLPTVVAWLLLLLLAVYLGGYWGLFVLLSQWLRPQGERVLADRLPAAAAAAGLWTLLEIVREVLFSGFPWSPVGEALLEFPGALDLAPWIGVRGLTFFVMLVNALLVLVAVDQVGGVARATWTMASMALLMPVVFAGASVAAQEWQESLGGGGPDRPVRIVQPDVPIVQTPAERVEGYRRLMELSRCVRGPELVVWPESAAFPYRWDRDEGLRRGVASALGDGCALLFNTSLEVDLPDGGVGYSNSALLLGRDGVGGGDPGATGSADGLPRPGPDGIGSGWRLQRYDKVHLVPYGEYVPMRELLPFVDRLARSVGDFEPGSDATLLGWRGLRLGMAICFEIIFPREVALRVRRGADVLVTITNDAWFGASRAPWQHLGSARFRAAESRRPVIFAAVTGPSAGIDARGRIVASLEPGEADVLRLDLASLLLPGPAAGAPTPYSRRPWLPEAVAGLCLLGGLLVVRRRRVAPTP